jgi:DNA-binding transcriptional ArsR family regulator
LAGLATLRKRRDSSGITGRRAPAEERAHRVPLRLRNELDTLVGVDTVLHALADGSRRTLLEILRDHPATAGELADALPIARPGVSRHLRVLHEAGLVDVRQDAQRRIYSLRPAPLAEVDAWLENYRALWRNRLDALHTEVARSKTRTNRSRS